MDETTTILDLITIYFGDQETQARPFDFSKDSKGDLLRPIKASTSCPHCGHGQEVDLENWTHGAIGVQCTNCGAGDNYFLEQSLNKDANSTTIEVDRSDLEKELEEDLSTDINTGESIVIEANNSITIDDSNDVSSLKSACPFIDPIELGLIQIEQV